MNSEKYVREGEGFSRKLFMRDCSPFWHNVKINSHIGKLVVTSTFQSLSVDHIIVIDLIKKKTLKLLRLFFEWWIKILSIQDVYSNPLISGY